MYVCYNIIKIKKQIRISTEVASLANGNKYSVFAQFTLHFLHCCDSCIVMRWKSNLYYHLEMGFRGVWIQGTEKPNCTNKRIRTYTEH